MPKPQARAADDAAGEDERPFVRAHVLAGVPLPFAGELEDSDLHAAVLDRRAPFERKIGDAADGGPLGIGVFARLGTMALAAVGL